MITKDSKQQEIVDIYLNYRKDKISNNLSPNSCIISATGTGKSRMTMLILESIYLNYDKIYIVVNADRLRDFTWKEEFGVWNKQHILDKVELVNYQSIYKWNKDLTNCFIVYDEVDYAIGTPKYSMVFTKYANIHSLGLTGYCAESKKEELEKILPVIVEYSFNDAVNNGIINDVHFVFVKFDLSKNKNDIRVTWKKNGVEQEFYQSENDAYDYADKEFRKAYGAWEKGQADFVMGLLSSSKLNSLEYTMKRMRDKRLSLLYNNISSRTIVKKLQENILTNPDNKIIIFSKYTDQANSLCAHTYHSKNTEDINNSNIDKFNSGEIRTLAVCSKIDRGENLVGLNNIILESYNSSDTIISQRRGQFGLKQVNSVKPKS